MINTVFPRITVEKICSQRALRWLLTIVGTREFNISNIIADDSRILSA